MNVVVFGANGGIGHHVVEQALAAGHAVTAVARRPESISIQHERLTIVRGDVLDPASIAATISPKAAVVSALGVATRAPTTVYSQGVANILCAMQTAGACRLICVSASGLDPSPWIQHLLAKPLLWLILKNMYTDLAKMEAEVRASPLNWTILRPPQFTNGPRTGRYTVTINAPLNHSWQISRADIADYIVNHLDDPATHRALVEIAY